jgi:hypothetical protein
MIESQINLALKATPKGRSKYFIGKDETLQPKIQANLLTFDALPTRANYDLAKLIFNPEVA